MFSVTPISSTSAPHVAFDWMLVLANSRDEEVILERTIIIRKLKAAGLATTVCQSIDRREIHIFIRAPSERLELEAEMAGLKKPMLDGGGLAPFSIAKRHLFVGATEQQGLFTSAERQRLVYRAIISSSRLHGANLDFAALHRAGILLRVCPVHDKILRQVPCAGYPIAPMKKSFVKH